MNLNNIETQFMLVLGLSKTDFHLFVVIKFLISFVHQILSKYVDWEGADDHDVFHWYLRQVVDDNVHNEIDFSWSVHIHTVVEYEGVLMI